MDLEIVAGKVFDVIGVVDATIAEMDSKYLALKINGVKDKKGYEAVHEGRMLYVHTRTNIEKKGLELRKKAKASIEDYLSAEQAEERRILALLKPGEERLTAEERAYTDALATIKAEEERREQERIQGRRDRLAGLGVGFNGNTWTLDLPVGIKALPDVVVRTLTDAQFEEQVGFFTAMAEEDKKVRLAERMRVEAERETLAKVAADQEAERLRLEAIAKEQKEKEDALRAEAEKIGKDKQAAIDAENKRLADIERQKQKALDDAARAAELEKARQEAALQATKTAEAKAAQDAADKIESERLDRVAADKKAAKLPDKAKLSQLLDEVFSITTPDLKTPEARQAFTDICGIIEEAEKSCRKRLAVL